MKTERDLSVGIPMKMIPQMTVAENIYLGREPTTWCVLVDMRKMNRPGRRIVRSTSNTDRVLFRPNPSLEPFGY
jgi:ABC-type sugar transport system ATPase subunit